MISIIICSQHESISEELKENIDRTIGISNYEILWIYNECNKYSIFQAYSIGVEKASGDILCFMHEDILFHTEGWGINATNALLDAAIGLVGVIGGHLLSHTAHCWAFSQMVKGQVIQGRTSHGKYRTQQISLDSYPELGNEVVCVDGLWMCIKKSMFTRGIIHWDHDTYSPNIRFHLYDMDISMQVITAGYKILVIDSILIEHKSSGVYDDTFIKASIIFNEKWSSFLPVYAPKNMHESLIKQAWRAKLEAENNNYSKNARLLLMMKHSPFLFIIRYIWWAITKRHKLHIPYRGTPAFRIESDSLL